MQSCVLGLQKPLQNVATFLTTFTGRHETIMTMSVTFLYYSLSIINNVFTVFPPLYLIRHMYRH